MKQFLTILLLTLGVLPLTAQKIWYVALSAVGGAQNGQDWPNAYTDLQSALGAATAGDAIWVAEGVYYPTETSDRTVSFALKQGVRLYGGFAGTETDPGQRQWSAHPTVLSGNIGDGAARTDNSYSIVTGEGLDSTTCLDGFVLRENYGDKALAGALYLRATAQAPLTCPVIRNCRFEDNYAVGGAAIHCNWGQAGVVSPRLEQCVFRRNYARQYGGAVLKSGPSPAAHPFVVSDCEFSDNRVQAGPGGGVYFWDVSGYSRFVRCRFERDSAVADAGGGIYCPLALEQSDLQLDSCDFIENYADNGGGICYDEYKILQPDTILPFICRMNHCRFERNKSRDDGGTLYFYSGPGSLMSLYLEDCVIKDSRNQGPNACVFQAYNECDIYLSVRNTQFIDNVDYYQTSGLKKPLSYGVAGKTAKGRAVIENCLFARNENAALEGLTAGIGGMLESHITNCTFYQNNRFVISKSWNAKHDDSTFYDRMYITNCIFWEDSKPEELFADNNFMVYEMGGYYIDHVLVKNPKNTMPPVLGPHVLYATYPLFADTAKDDFRLMPCSPAVNYGDNGAAVGLPTDLLGKPRVYGDTVDLGAYETQDTCNTVGVGSAAAQVAGRRAAPNPVRTGSRVWVSGGSGGAMAWRLADATGRVTASSRVVEYGDGFWVEAPAAAGLYVLWLEGADGRTEALRVVVVR